jgi:hypothetical protein
MTDIRTLDDLIAELRTAGVADEPRAHVRFWYRGQARSGWRLQPAVYRDNWARKTEDDRLLSERHLSQDFRVLYATLRAGSETDEQLYFLQQHYRMPTRLLDWTTSPLAALFFACRGEQAHDGQLFMLDAENFEPVGGRSFSTNNFTGGPPTRDFRGIATARHVVFRICVARISGWRDDLQFPDFIVPVRPDHFDVRIRLQRSCFTFHVPNETLIDPNVNKTLRAFTIPMNNKEQILKELKTVSVDAFSVWGDFEHLAETLKEAYGV